MRVGSLVTVGTLLAIGASTSVPAASPDWPKSLTLGTASPGVYYICGEELAQILTEKLGIPVDPLPTQGTVHNVKLGISAEINHGSWNAMITELLAGHLDAFLAVIGAPMPAVQKDAGGPESGVGAVHIRRSFTRAN
jgi:TRAP-type uncharacterized transport system substrate-binding protein